MLGPIKTYPEYKDIYDETTKTTLADKITMVKLKNSDQLIKETTINNTIHEQLFIKRQLSTTAANTIEVITLFVNSFVIVYYQNFS